MDEVVLAASILQLQEELRAAQQELMQLERLVEELPRIFEDKFRQQTATVVEGNRQLRNQRDLLQQQLSQTLLASAPPAVTPPTPSRPRLALPPLNRPSRRRLGLAVLVCGGSGLLGWGLVAGLGPGGDAPRPAIETLTAAERLGRGSPATQSPARETPARESPVSKSTVTLRSLGSSWVEVQDLVTRQTVWVDVLEPGTAQPIRMRRGLRIRSGRPDLLSVQIDNHQPFPFGSLNGVDWRTLRPQQASPP